MAERERYARDRARRKVQAAEQRERDRESGALVARQAVRLALRRGGLARPDHCEKCGAPDAPLADGRTSLQAHHADYSRPLDVSWHCVRCHGVEHRRAAT